MISLDSEVPVSFNLQEPHLFFDGTATLQPNYCRRRRKAPYQGEGVTFCTYCMKNFDFPWRLQRHLRSHTGERPYPCQFCDYSARRKERLTQHMTTSHPNLFVRNEAAKL